MARTVIIGTGTWGSAMAVLLARRGDQEVLLYGRRADKVAHMADERRHPHLTGDIPPAVVLTADPAACAGADLVLWAVPTQHSRAIAQELAPHLGDAPVLSLAKGLEQETLLRVSEVLAQTLGPRLLGCLSGPSHAEEVVAGLPVSLVAAGPDELTEQTLERVHSQHLRCYTSPDLVGTELGGALKNVIAIAAGICDGLGLGDNAKAALITRGLAEMRRLGRAQGANDASFAGLAGIGDLLATCYSPHGRNRALGLAVGQGAVPSDLLANTDSVAEGAWTCRAAVALAQRHGVDCPLAGEVAAVIWNDKPVTSALEDLLSRAPKLENA